MRLRMRTGAYTDVTLRAKQRRNTQITQPARPLHIGKNHPFGYDFVDRRAAHTLADGDALIAGGHGSDRIVQRVGEIRAIVVFRLATYRIADRAEFLHALPQHFQMLRLRIIRAFAFQISSIQLHLRCVMT